MRQAVNCFRTHAEDQTNRLEGGAKDDLQYKHARLLAFDFEAAVRLKSWASLGQIVKVGKIPGTPLRKATDCSHEGMSSSGGPKSLRSPGRHHSPLRSAD